MRRSFFRLKKDLGMWGIVEKSTGNWMISPRFQWKEQAEFFLGRMEYVFARGITFQFQESNKKAQALMEKFGI